MNWPKPKKGDIVVSIYNVFPKNPYTGDCSGIEQVIGAYKRKGEWWVKVKGSRVYNRAKGYFKVEI